MGQKKGFACMDPEKVKAIASLGGLAAQKKGTHHWTSETARIAGRKGGLGNARRLAALKQQQEDDKLKGLTS